MKMPKLLQGCYFPKATPDNSTTIATHYLSLAMNSPQIHRMSLFCKNFILRALDKLLILEDAIIG